MQKSAATVTDFIADVSERSGLDWRGFAALGREIEQRAETAEAMDQFQVADHPEVQTGRGRERKIRQNSEHPQRPAGGRWAGILFDIRHGLNS